eukprot:GHVR01153247.1.p1 GENE.GHVR01153247.1~~GHVR01153247.1.p1  ORF type:complete len:253 (-),score=17.55 GHVR01153247.1:1497-2231(-)
MSFALTSNDDYKNDLKLDSNATPLVESVSSISWANTNTGPIFAATTWDGMLGIYEATKSQYGPTITQKIITKIMAPLTKCCWNPDNTILYVGCGDGTIKAFDITTSNIVDVGKHNTAISSLYTIPNQNVLISTGYEKEINFWQPGNNTPVYTVDVLNKVYTSDFQYPILIAGTENEKLTLIDVNQVGQKIEWDSDLGKHSQIQSISLNNKCTTLGIASFDGRANISHINKSTGGGYQQVMFLLS